LCEDFGSGARPGTGATRACLLILNGVVGDDLGMVRDGVFSDEVWAVVEPLLPSSKGRAGRPWTDHRRALEGIAWRYRTGSPWRDLPVEFGPWQTVWERHFRWSQDGTYQRIFDGVHLAGLLQQSLDPELERLLSVDSTVVRAHQHAAGARRSSIGAPAPATPAQDTGGTIELHEFAG
jgi:putative transposase